MSGLTTTFVDLPSETTPIDAAYLNAVNARVAGAFSTWTPVLTAATTNPTLGSGSVQDGGYVQIGKLVTAWFHIQFGSSGISAGSGDYRISLPVTGATSSSPIIPLGFGSGFLAPGPFSLLRHSTTTMKLWMPSGSAYFAGSGIAAGAQLWGNITYEAATAGP